MYKILILAYLIGQDPLATMQTFEMEKKFNSMEECKNELLLKDPIRDTYDVLWEFVEDTQFEYDWLIAGCKNDETGEEFQIEPEYPKGKPPELQGIELNGQLKA